jgi:hypothetical protein
MSPRNVVFLESATEVNLRFALGLVQALAMNKYYWDLQFVTLRVICFKCGMSGKLKQEVGRFVLRSLGLRILFGINRNC